MKKRIYKRHVVIIMLQVCVAIMYTYGTIHGITRPYMYKVLHPNVTNKKDAITCPGTADATKKHLLTGIVRTRSDMHRVKFTFAASKVLAHFVAGNICDVSGSRYVLLFSVFTSAVLTAVYPTMLLYLPVWVELLYNMVLGFVNGLIMPVLMNLIANWATLNRRTAFVGWVYAGAPISLMMEYGLIEYFIIFAEYWQGTFYFMCLLGCGFCLVSLGTVFSKPNTHPFITEQELQMLESENGRSRPKQIPWKMILTDSRVYAILAGKLAHLWIQYIKSHFLPLYYSRVLKYELGAYGSMNLALPSIIQYLACIVWAVVAQRTINKNRASLVHMRIFFTMFGALVPAVFLVAMSYGECNILIAQITSVFLHFGMAPMNLGVKSNILDLTRNFAGFTEGFVNGIATACGMFLQPLLSALIRQDGLQEWRVFFWITLAIVMYLTTLHYVFIGVERASWDELNVTDYDEHDKHIY